MSTLLSWMPSIVAFLVFFVGASLVSGVVYVLARNESDVARVLNVFALLVVLGALLYAVWIYIYRTPSPLPFLFVAILIATACSALQAFIEKSIVRQDSVRRRHFVRAFFCYCGSIFYGYVLFTQVFQMTISFHFLSRVDVLAANRGFQAGLIFAPLSISFYRWAFQTLALRPGVDRALREDEVAAR